MGTTTVIASGLIDYDGSPLNGSINFGSRDNINLEITNGSLSGSVPSGTYDVVGVADSAIGIAELKNVTLPDGETYTINVNGQWALKVGDAWIPLNWTNTGVPDLALTAGKDSVLPAAPQTGQGIMLVNTGQACNLSAAVPIGNGSAPATSLSLGELAAANLRFDGICYRIVSLVTAPQ